MGLFLIILCALGILYSLNGLLYFFLKEKKVVKNVKEFIVMTIENTELMWFEIILKLTLILLSITTYVLHYTPHNPFLNV